MNGTENFLRDAGPLNGAPDIGFCQLECPAQRQVRERPIAKTSSYQPLGSGLMRSRRQPEGCLTQARSMFFSSLFVRKPPGRQPLGVVEIPVLAHTGKRFRSLGKLCFPKPSLDPLWKTSPLRRGRALRQGANGTHRLRITEWRFCVLYLEIPPQCSAARPSGVAYG